MSRMRQRVRSESDEIRIRMYLVFGGFHYRTVAKMVYGRNYSESDVAHVGKVARAWDLSSRDWRNGKTVDAKSYLKSVEGTPRVKKAVKATAEGEALPLKLAVAG